MPWAFTFWAFGPDLSLTLLRRRTSGRICDQGAALKQQVEELTRQRDDSKNQWQKVTLDLLRLQGEKEKSLGTLRAKGVNSTRGGEKSMSSSHKGWDGILKTMRRR